MPTISLKTIVLIHWFLVIWAVSGSWSITAAIPPAIPPAYVWCNVTVLAIGVWAIADRQSVDALFMYIVMQLLSVIVDIVVLAVYFPGSEAPGISKFAAGMAILNLILKPFSSILLYKMYRDRGGEYNINFGPNNTAYDNIGDDSTGSSADFRNVLQPGYVGQQPPHYQPGPPPGAHGGSKEQPLI